MESVAVFAAFVVAAALARVVRAYLSPDRRMRRMLRRTPRIDIAQARDGGAAIIMGTLALAGEPLVAPLTGRRCACYDVFVEERQGDGGWSTVLYEARGTSFHVADATGKALVIVDESMDDRITLVADQTFEGDNLRRVLNLDGFLAARGLSSEGLLLRRQLRCSEGVLAEGGHVAVAGTCRWEADVTGTLRAGDDPYRAAPQRLRIESTKALPLHVSSSSDVLRAAAK